jgi:ABC-2 type transport system ATP-binding protein
MKQRCCLAKTLIHDPKVLLLDEPASGLDPRARIEIRALLKELHRMGKTILISSHILPELADLCTTIGILERGQLVYQGSVSEAVRRARVGTVVHVVTPDDQERARQVLGALQGVQSATLRDGTLVLDLGPEQIDFSFIAEAMLQNKLRIQEIKQEEVNLETAFMRLTKGMVQ